MARQVDFLRRLWWVQVVYDNKQMGQKKDKEVCVTLGQVGLFSQIFKPITTALRQVKMKGKQ